MNYLQCSLPSCQHELKIFFWFQNCAKIKWKIDLRTTGFKKITMMGLLMTNVLRRVLFYLWERVNLLLKVILGTSMLHSAPQALIYLSLSKLASEYESGIQHVKNVSPYLLGSLSQILCLSPAGLYRSLGHCRKGAFGKKWLFGETHTQPQIPAPWLLQLHGQSQQMFPETFKNL